MIHGFLFTVRDLVYNKFKQYSLKISWTLFLLICVFTMGSWIDVSGIWCELPLMVDELPEGWRLPSIMSVTSQMAQTGPFIFLAVKLLFPNRVNNTKVIYFIFIVGALSCLMLSILWNKTEVIFGERRSIYLYIFNFTFALLDGMSTITFLPYIGEHFIKEYIIPNYIGESLSSLIPGVLGILQQIDSQETCQMANETANFILNRSESSNETHIETVFQSRSSRFSVSVYFFLMFVLIVMSVMSFTTINLWDRVKKQRKVSVTSSKELANVNENTTIETTSTTATAAAVEVKRDSLEIGILFLVTFVVSFIYYGHMPGLLSYTTIPYGNGFFHWSINLSCVCLPFSIILSIWSYNVTVKRILIETSIPILISVYIYFVSSFSPCPPFVNSSRQAGGYLIVACWVLSSCLFMRIRCLIATKLEKYGKNMLFTIGCITLLGQVIGGVIIFVQVEIYRMFTEMPKCSPDDYCLNY